MEVVLPLAVVTREFNKVQEREKRDWNQNCFTVVVVEARKHRSEREQSARSSCSTLAVFQVKKVCRHGITAGYV